MHASVSALLVRPLVAALEPSAARDAFFTATDLTPELVADADARISPAQLSVAWSALARLSGEPAIALTVASQIPQGAFGIVEYVCRSAPTLRDSLAQWVRYLNLLNGAVEVGLIVEDEHACVRVLVESEVPAPASHELCFAVLALRMRQLTESPVRPLAVELTHRVADPRPYERFFDAPVRFGADVAQLVVPRRALSVPLRTADASLLRILRRVADEERAALPDEPLMAARVRRVLRAALRDNEASIEHVAVKLGLTARSLQRRLKDEGSSFQALREELRRELAERYLSDDLSIAEISFLLGFSEPSAFFRAFKRWTGLTPLERRAVHRQA